MFVIFVYYWGMVFATDVCFVGYIMDTYCINRGTLFDRPQLRTLEDPQEHSVHCLVDVSWCYNSGFQILADPEEGRSLYCPAYKLDQTSGTQMVLDLARATGSCSTCTGAGSLVKGFRATVRGTLTGDMDLTATEVLDASVGCPNGLSVPASCNFADLFWLHLVQEYPEILSEEISFEKLKQCLSQTFQEQTISEEMARIFFNAAGLDEGETINVEQTSRLAKLKHMETFSNVFRILNDDLSGIQETEHIVDKMIGKEDDATPAFSPLAGMSRNFTRNATWFGTDSEGAMEMEYAILNEHE